MIEPGLHRLDEAQLTRLARALARADFPEPITRSGLMLAKLGDLELNLEALIGRSKALALAILSVLLRERAERPQVHARLTWSGPDTSASGTRAPYESLQELIARAERSLFCTGLSLARDARLLSSLHAAQRGQGLDVTIVVSESAAVSGRQALLASATALFLERLPWPRLLVPDPARLSANLPVCTIVDERRVLLLSGAAAAIEPPEHDVCAGVLVDGASLASALRAQFDGLLESGALWLLEPSGS
jgi:hypothetical protein